MLPATVVARLLDEGDVLGLKMGLDSAEAIYYFRALYKEGPNNLEDFSLGSASAQATAGTEWQDIQDANARYLLEPEFERHLYQLFYGVMPSYAWVYKRYPSGTDRGSLLGTRSVGDRTYRVGKVDGLTSPYHAPSPETELFILKGNRPSFLGYHPYLEPASITVRLNFFIVRYFLEVLKAPTTEEKARAKVRTMGGIAPLVPVPQWLR